MTAHFDEFEEEMTSRSLERAYDYVDEHRIGGLEEVSAGLFHAEVHGSELYDVDIRLRGNDIVFASCTCPYDYDGYCKHIGAVLLTLRDYKHGGNHQQNVTLPSVSEKIISSFAVRRAEALYCKGNRPPYRSPYSSRINAVSS